MIHIPAVAITVAPYYLDVKKWALKAMGVYKGWEGGYHWKVVKTLGIDENRARLAEKAVKIGVKFTVPYLRDVKQDQVLLPAHKAELVKRGLLKLGT